jgi:sensor histidine kinase regulating citrate/malate metabolism
MPTKKEKLKEAFRLDANIGDKEIRQIRAVSMGVSLHEYEKTLKAIGRDDFD